MNEVKIFEKDGKLYVQSPYNPDFPGRARKLGGRWNGRVWIFDPRDKERVRDLCLGIYGYDGREEGQAEVVDVRLYLDKVGSRLLSNRTVWHWGRQILMREGRDRPVSLGPGVVIIEGGFHLRGGSAKYPVVGDALTGTVLEVRDVPRSLIEAEDEDGTFEIVAESISEPETVMISLSGTALEFLSRARENSPGLSDDEIITAALNLYDMKFNA